jgi:predicted O-methyltransferase YrrM
VPVDLRRSPTSDPTRVYRYRDGLYAADLITAALVHLDLLTILAARPMTLVELCRALELRERPADVLVTLLAATGLVVREGDVIHVSTMGREHATTGSPFNIVPYYASLKDRPVVKDFVSVLRTDRPAHWGGDDNGADWHAAMEHESFAQAFTAAMDCRGLYLGGALAGALDLAGASRLLDVGGGSGIYACTLAARHPTLLATVMDQAPVDRIASRKIAERGFADRVTVHTADMFTESWPPHHDVHLFSNVLHDWGVEPVRTLIRRSAETLTAGGLVVIHDAFINAAKTGPLPVAEYSALLMHSTQGKCYATSEYERFLLEAGFTDVHYRETAADRGVMTARLA